MPDYRYVARTVEGRLLPARLETADDEDAATLAAVEFYRDLLERSGDRRRFTLAPIAAGDVDLAHILQGAGASSSCPRTR